jgi:hypothetical protein
MTFSTVLEGRSNDIMADQHINEQLNQLVINLGRSLLQYVGETWPWVPVGAEVERSIILQLVERQQRNVARLVDLLDERHWTIHMGVYPLKYGDLHYVALDYLLSELVAGQQSLISDVEHTLALSSAQGDSATTALLGEILAEEREILERLQELRDPQPTAAA